MSARMTQQETISLFKYVPISTRSLSIIATRKIWCPKPMRFNDPFDCGIDLDGNMTIEEEIQVLRAEMEREHWAPDKITAQLQRSFTSDRHLNSVARDNIRKLNTAIHEQRDNAGVLSLSANCESILMWSHYAAQHAGMCVEFLVPLSAGVLPVDYSAAPPHYTLHDIFVKRDSSILTLFTTKDQDWAYEKEYRLVFDRGDFLLDIPGPIRTIIFGMRTTPDDEALVRTLAANLGSIRFRRCRKAQDRFAVIIEDVQPAEDPRGRD